MNAGEEDGMTTQKLAGSIAGEERIGMVIAGERKSARADSGRLVIGSRLALSVVSSTLSSAHCSRPGVMLQSTV